MKKRHIVLCICCILSAMLALPMAAAAADTTEYTIDDLGITLSIPSEYYVFTRDMPSDHPNLIAYGLTRDDLLSILIETDTYLSAFDKDVTGEISITMSDNPLNDFNTMSDTMLEAFAAAFPSVYKSGGMTVTKYGVYRQARTKFVLLYFYEETNVPTTYSAQYLTIYNGKSIYLTYHSYTGEFSNTAALMLKGIVDSIVFSEEPKAANPLSPSSATGSYTDPATGLTFTIPDNWEEVPLLLSHELLDAKFKSLTDINLSITYGSADVWSGMSPFERIGYSRSDIDNSYYTISELASIYNVPIDDVKKVTYGGNTFYSVGMTQSAEALGTSVTVTMTQATILSNGHMYVFQFNDSADNLHYADFETLLSSVRLPE